MGVCDLCGADVAKVDRHRGTQRCLLKQLSRSSVRLADGGNFRRHLKSRCRAAGFLGYLKANVQMSRADASQKCNFVPYAQMEAVSADIARIAAEIRAGARAEGIRLPMQRASDRYTESQLQMRARMLAATNCCALFFTPRAAALVGIPPVPWTAEYAAELLQGILAAHASGAQLFNTAITFCSSKSMLQMSRAEATAAAETMVEICEGVTEAADAGSRLWLNAEAHADEFHRTIAASGFPAGGYIMSLASCLWRFGGVVQKAAPARKARRKQARRRGDGGTYAEHLCRAEPYTDARHFPVLPAQRGTAGGIATLTGDDVQTLTRSKSLQRYRLGQIASCIAELWSTESPRVRDPFAKFAELRVDAVARQLCEWHKGGMQAKPAEPKTMRRARETL